MCFSVLTHGTSPIPEYSAVGRAEPNDFWGPGHSALILWWSHVHYVLQWQWPMFCFHCRDPEDKLYPTLCLGLVTPQFKLSHLAERCGMLLFWLQWQRGWDLREGISDQTSRTPSPILNRPRAIIVQWQGTLVGALTRLSQLRKQIETYRVPHLFTDPTE